LGDGRWPTLTRMSASLPLSPLPAAVAAAEAPATPAGPRPTPGVDAYVGTAQAVPFWLMHLAAIVGVALVGWSWTGLAWAVGLYYLRMFFVTGAYHRYFSHKTYKTSRAFQFFLAFMAQTSSQ